jgi:hypothetical protein
MTFCLPLRHALLGLAMLSMPACLGGQTGQESEDTVDCEYEYESEAVALDAETPLGFSALAVLANVTEPLTAQARFFQLELTRDVTLELGQAGAARAVRPGTALAGCQERVEIDLEARFSSHDGALDESFETTLHAVAVSSWSLRQSLPLTDLTGSYDGSEYDLRSFRNPSLRLDAEFRKGAFSGGIWLEGDDPTPGDGSDPTSPYVAEWPAPP